MNSTLKSFKRFSSLTALVALCLFVANGCVSTGQNTATVEVIDVSVFPEDVSVLPGKGSDNIWNGLAGVWNRNHIAWMETAEADKGAIVFLGDSITQGWGDSLEGHFEGIHVANRGIGGDITRGVLYRLQADVLALNPKAVVLLIGTNDIGNNNTPEDVSDNIKQILMDIKAFNPAMPVIVCKTMPRRGEQNLANISELNALVEEYVDTESNFVMCDTWTPFLNAEGQPNPEIFNRDLLHLNAGGYDTWEAALKPVLTEIDLD